MSRITLAVFFLTCVLAGHYSNSHLLGEVRSESESNKLLHHADDDYEDDADMPVGDEEDGQQLDAMLINADGTKKCAGVGSFCMSHSDCCSNACLGYMKRCVSG